MASDGDLFVAAKNGDTAAIDSIYDRYHYMAERIADCLHSPYVEQEDMRQYARYWLCRAVESYDVSRGTEFSTYAYHIIYGQLRHMLTKSNIIHIPKDLYPIWHRLLNEQTRIMFVENRSPKITECARNLGIDEQIALRLQLGFADVQSFEDEAPLNIVSDDSDNLSISDRVVDRDDLDAVEDMTLRLSVEPAIAQLPKRLQNVIRMLYYENMSIGEVAQMMHITHQRVCQLRNKALQILKCNASLRSLALPRENILPSRTKKAKQRRKS